MQVVALGWHVYDTSGNPLDLGLIGLAQFCPVLAFSFLAGALADRMDRRHMLAIGMATSAVLSTALFVAVWWAGHRLWPIYLIAIGLGTAKAFIAPAAKSLLP